MTPIRIGENKFNAEVDLKDRSDSRMKQRSWATRRSTWLGAALIAWVAGAMMVTWTPSDVHAALSKRVRVRGKCHNCHKESANEWKNSPHRHAWTDPLFVKLSNNHEKKECLGCHAPDGVYVQGIGKPPVVRESLQDAGVDCAGCHRDAEGAIHGVHGLDSPDHDVVKDDTVGTVQMCAACHAQFGTVDEFKKSRWASNPAACITCHMEEVERPLTPATEPRKSRKHLFTGKTNKDLVASGLSLEASAAGDKLIVKLISKGVGHKFPTGHDTKQAIIDVQVKNGDQLVLQKRAVLGVQGGQDNRLEPGSTFTLEVPTEGKHGKAVVRVLHKAHPEVPDDEAIVVLTTEVDL